jgi:Asp-tRNA(Asn)/Glu-tRNA(Gln) amidotransferase A subunit family amidase
MNALTGLTAREAAARIRSGSLLASGLVQALLDRIDALDPLIKAWVCVDRRGALEAARMLDDEARSGRWRGPLHGVPVGLKDIYDVAGLTTTAGAGSHAHRQPHGDAESVRRLRRAGAVILGKTKTTEFAYLDPTDTVNPWNPHHTPGGSSSGSAAAVASRMVPLALGSQTVGSTLRPAGYCGVVGFKPTYGRIPCAGIVPLAESFDHVGILCRSVADAALCFQVLTDGSEADPGRQPNHSGDAATPAERPPRLGLPRMLLERAGPEIAAHLEAVARTLARAGAEIEDVELPPSFAGVHDAGACIMQAEAAAHHAQLFAAHADAYGPKMRTLIEAGQRVSSTDRAAAERQLRLFREEIRPLLDRVGALLMPVAGSTAPRGLSSTGDPYFCAPWSFAGLPAIALPSGLSTDRLPLSIQLVSAPFGDQRLLGAASWCEAILAFDAAPELPLS